MTNPGQNDTRFDDFITEVRAFAREGADGVRHLGKLYAKVVRAAADGVISTEKNKHGKGVDDASMIFDEYAKAFSKKMGPHGGDGKKASTSKLRQTLKFGEMVLPVGDAVDVMMSGLSVRAKLFEADEKSVQDEAKTIVAIARAQLAQPDSILTEEELEAVVRKPEPKTKELTEFWEGVLSNVQKVVTGDNRHGLKDQSDQAVSIEDTIREYVGTLTLMSKRAQLLKDAAELGLDVNERAA